MVFKVRSRWMAFWMSKSPIYHRNDMVNWLFNKSLYRWLILNQINGFWHSMWNKLIVDSMRFEKKMVIDRPVSYCKYGKKSNKWAPTSRFHLFSFYSLKTLETVITFLMIKNRLNGFRDFALTHSFCSFAML